MTEKQQVLNLWLAESALDTFVIGWAFYDGTSGYIPTIPLEDPPYKIGTDALKDGWFLIQSPALPMSLPGSEHNISYLPNEFVFERRFTE